MFDLTIDTSRQHTTHAPLQLEMVSNPRPMTRGQVHRSLELRIGEGADCTMVGHIWRHRHYLQKWPCPPRTKLLHYVGDLQGMDPGPVGCAVAVTIALMSGTKSRVLKSLCEALNLHPCCLVELVRSFRSDIFEPEVAPDLMPYTLRRIIAGGNGVRSLADEWNTRQLTGGLEALARICLTYADPTMEADGGPAHDGGLYRGAGAVFVGKTVNGKLGYAWALDPSLKEPLKQYSAAIAEREVKQ